MKNKINNIVKTLKKPLNEKVFFLLIIIERT